MEKDLLAAAAADALFKSAFQLHRNGKYTEAESAYAKLLANYRELAKEDPEEYRAKVASTLNNLGTLHVQIGSYSDAEAELEENGHRFQYLSYRNAAPLPLPGEVL